MKDRWIIEGINNWKQLMGIWSWYTWTLIHVEFEKENMAYGYEFIFVLLGFGFRIRYNTDKALKQFEEWENDEMEVMSEKELAEWLNEDLTDKKLVDHYSNCFTDLKDK